MALRLYSSTVSPHSRKVRLLAAELNLPVEIVEVSLFTGEHLKPEFAARNPNQRVPVLDDGGFLVWESAAILRYLAALKPGSGLLPDTPKDLARLDQWSFWWTSHPEPAMRTLGEERIVKPALGQPANDPALTSAAEAQLERLLPLLEVQLADRQFVLDSLTVFDFMAAPLVEGLPHLGIDLAPYPCMLQWLQRMQAKPYWRTA